MQIHPVYTIAHTVVKKHRIVYIKLESTVVSVVETILLPLCVSDSVPGFFVRCGERSIV